MASLCVLNILRVSAWSDAVSIPCLGWQSFVLLHEYFDPSATGKDLVVEVTVDLYAPRQTRKCPSYAQYLGGEGSIGDIRSLKPKPTENYWVSPPLTQLRQSIMRILESGVAATIVVPNWPNRPWHVLLRHHANQIRMLKWNENLPVMWDVCVQSKKHVRLVDKWDFLAFAVGGSEDTTWEQRCKPVVSGKTRLKLLPAIWSPKHRRKAIKTSDGCSVMPLLCRMMAQEFNASYEVVVVKFDPICQQFVQWHFPEAANGRSSDVLD